MKSGLKTGLVLGAVTALAGGTFALLLLTADKGERNGEHDRSAPEAEPQAMPSTQELHVPAEDPPLSHLEQEDEDDWLALTPGKSRRSQRKRKRPRRRKTVAKHVQKAEPNQFMGLADIPQDSLPDEEADTIPPAIRVLTPKSPAVIMTPKLLLRVRSEPGARLQVDDQPLTENSPGLYARNLRLTVGRNNLKIKAFDEAGNLSEVGIRVTYVDTSRIEKRKDRFTHLMVQLDEVQAAAAEMDHQIGAIIRKLRKGGEAERIPELSKELRSIRNTRRELRMEIERAIGEIDKMMATSK